MDKGAVGNTNVSERFKHFLCLQICQIEDTDDANYLGNDSDLNIFGIFASGKCAPILYNAKDLTEEPIQKEPYLPLLQSFSSDYKIIVSTRDQIFGPLKPDL